MEASGPHLPPLEEEREGKEGWRRVGRKSRKSAERKESRGIVGGEGRGGGGVAKMVSCPKQWPLYMLMAPGGLHQACPTRAGHWSLTRPVYRVCMAPATWDPNQNSLG